MLCNLYSNGSKKAFEDNRNEYVLFAYNLMEIENKKCDIFPPFAFEENPELVRISEIKVNLMELIALIIDGINEKDEKHIENIFSIFPPVLVLPSTTTSSVSPPTSYSSSSSFVSCSSQMLSFSSSTSDSPESPPLLSTLICIAEESLLRPRNEFEFQKSVKIIISLIKKKFINEDEVADLFFSSLLSNFHRERRHIQRMALYFLVSELPSLKELTNTIHDENNLNVNDDFRKIGETDEIKEISLIGEIEKIDVIEKVNESDKISEIEEINDIANDMSDSDCGDFISIMQDVFESDYGKI